MNPSVITTDAIVLQTNDFGESDRLVTFYTRTAGRLRGIAKAARKSKKRFVHTFEMLSFIELSYRERKSLVWIEACRLVDPYLALRTEVERWGYGALVVEVILEMVPEGDPQPELFTLLHETLGHLAESRDSVNVLLLFLVRFLDNMGYLPTLEACGVCGRPLKAAKRWWWNLKRGMLFCPEHRLPSEEGCVLDVGSLLLIQQWRSLPLERIWRLHLVQNKQRSLLYGLLDSIRHVIRKDLKSLRWLEELESA